MTKQITDLSIGIIPIDLTTSPPQFLILKHQKGHWSFPKGHQVNNEIFIETALREFNEETGVPLNQLQFFNDFKKNIFEKNYTFKNKGKIITKTVIFYLGFLNAQLAKVKIQETEIAAFKWANFEQCLELAQFQSTKNLIIKVNDYVKKISS
ncbi:MAG: NUDIX domain-containing protein [bacterium]|nr:NUDIX domain-containing protein [bacterium]